jgi:hypothetical protein
MALLDPKRSRRQNSVLSDIQLDHCLKPKMLCSIAFLQAQDCFAQKSSFEIPIKRKFSSINLQRCQSHCQFFQVASKNRNQINVRRDYTPHFPLQRNMRHRRPILTRQH